MLWCAQLCPTLCNPPGSSVYGIFQARILEQVAISYSRGSSQPRGWTFVFCISRQILYHLRSPFPALKGLTWALRSSVASMSHLYSLACSLFCLDGPSSWGYLSYQACAGGPFSPKLPFPGFPLRQVTPFHSANLAGSSDIISNMSHRSPGRTESLCLAFYVFGAHKSRMTL